MVKQHASGQRLASCRHARAACRLVHPPFACLPQVRAEHKSELRSLSARQWLDYEDAGDDD